MSKPGGTVNRIMRNLHGDCGMRGGDWEQERCWRRILGRKVEARAGEQRQRRAENRCFSRNARCATTTIATRKRSGQD